MNTYIENHRTGLIVIFMLVAVVALLVVTSSIVLAQGDNWLIGTDMSDASVYTVYAPTNTVYGPFLSGRLGTPTAALLDVAVTPDNQTALVSSFSESKIFFINLANPTNPICTGSVMVASGSYTIFAEDIAITPDSQYALVTDGAFSSAVFSIDIGTQTVVDVGTITNDAQSVDIAPDGTVVVAGYFSGTLDTFVIDGLGQLTWSGSYPLPAHIVGPGTTTDMAWPVNVRIAPDGQTVLVLSAFYGIAEIYTVNGIGTLVYSGSLSGLPGGDQSIAFNSTGDTGYLLSGSPTPDCLSVLNINSPGNVTLNTACVTGLEQNASGQLFGVDVVALAGNSIYTGHSAGLGGTPCACLSVVNPNDFSVLPLVVGGTPVSVASFYNSYIPSSGGSAVGPTVGGKVMLVNKSALLLQQVALPLRLMMNFVLR